MKQTISFRYENTYQRERYLDRDPIVHEHSDGSVTFQTVGDAQGVLDVCAEMRAENHRKDDGMRHVMRVPTEIMDEIRIKYGWDFMNPDHWPYVFKILKGPEYRGFRTYDGVI